MSHLQWIVQPGDEVPENVLAEYEEQLRNRLLDVQIAVFGDDLDDVRVTFSVPNNDRLRELASTTTLDDLVADLADSIRSEVATALELLAVDVGELPPTDPGAGAALEIELLLFDVGAGNAEVRWGIADAGPLNRAMDSERGLASLAATIDRAVRDALRTEIIDRGLLSRSFWGAPARRRGCIKPVSRCGLTWWRRATKLLRYGQRACDNRHSSGTVIKARNAALWR